MKLSQLSFLKGMSHNGRIITYTEPFWSIPFNLFTVYAVIYMLELGLTEKQVGLTQVVLVSFQIISSYFCGRLTDHIGKRRIIIIFDTLSWAGACFVWAFSRSPIGFFIAAALNGSNKAANVAFYCLLSEDATSSQRLRNFSGLHLTIIAGGFFAPLGGLLVTQMGIVKGTQIAYLIAGIMMGTMIISRHFALTEIEIPHHVTKPSTFKGLKDSLRYFVSGKQISTVFALQCIGQFYMVFKPLFYYAYLKDHVGVSSMFLSMIPLILSFITISVLLSVLPKIKNSQRKNMLLVGFTMGCLSLVLLGFVKEGSSLILSISIILDGVSIALMRPLIDSLWADSLHDDKRTRQLAASNLFIGLISIPAGSAAASLYVLTPILPFYVAALILLVAAGLTLKLCTIHDD